jgi:starch phosphorylase
MLPGTPYVIEVNPRVPSRLARLEELSENLWYSWDRQTRSLFARLHPGLWNALGHSPKAFLKRVDESRLIEASEDPAFLKDFNRVVSAYDSYHSEPLRRNGSRSLHEDDLVAYFCAEFGFHDSLPIYSGGLGFLAGDHCKAASDMRLPFVGVGLLYRQGYFYQIVDGEGRQHASYADNDFEDLPVTPVTLADGQELRVSVELPGRSVSVKVWRVQAGHVRLYLLDTDVAGNDAHDRGIAHRLYGGDRSTRIEQEIVLGIGGVRALAALGLRPTVWHMNEGHAAFLVLERIRGLRAQGLSFEHALEAVASNSVFTTHTAVPAGHDHFAEGMVRSYFEGYCNSVGVRFEDLMAMGCTPASGDFNMTALAVRGSRFQNGVSRIHGGVSSAMLKDLWPQVLPEENPVGYVTNGVHIPTFLAPEWYDIFERFLGLEWSHRPSDRKYWRRIENVPDSMFWSVHQHLKSRMLQLVRERVRRAHFRNQGSEAHLDRLLRYANPEDPNVLTIGFARRFATYKRAALLFDNLEWLRELVSDPKRPVLFVFAGKAHPADQPGQDLVRRIFEISRMPGFEGRVLMVEGYDLRLARRLVSGVDVWLNNPIYPLEASGTSGMKAGMNGVINLSVLDGWWGEGYEGTNGWAIKPASSSLDPARRDREEARTLYELLQDHVIPMYYNRGTQGYSPEWIRMAKRSIASILPRFNAERMVDEYVTKFYLPAAEQWRRFSAEGFQGARRLADWKGKVRAEWPRVTLRRLDTPRRRMSFGDSVMFEVAVQLAGLQPEDVIVELLLDRQDRDSGRAIHSRHRFEPQGAPLDTGERRYILSLKPQLCGRLDYRIRAFPAHELLTQPFELGLMLWV